MESPTQQHTSQHTYGTRIRQNSIIKPSSRLRHSPDPPHRSVRKIKPSDLLAATPNIEKPSNAHQYPTPDVVLHPEDATSKVFIALAKCFSSVDNRAMTIKDLSEMTLKNGLVCQNVGAASQAITTYIRTHLARCETQEDEPLLLRHQLLGTPADDHLLPALHSRCGGAQAPDKSRQKEDVARLTNFRRGTMVWYLSRVTGAPCPFHRAGIALREYMTSEIETTTQKQRQHKLGERESRRLAAKAEDHCGTKRKRSYPIDSSSDSDSSASQSDTEHPPTVKPRLTFRLPPLSKVTAALASKNNIDSDLDSDSSDDMSVDSEAHSTSDEDEEAEAPHEATITHQSCLPPYPRRSIAIPHYTPCLNPFPEPRRDRSPSVPYSVASLPPDSEDEEDDFHVSMVTGIRRRSSLRRRLNEDFEMEESLMSDDADNDALSYPASSPGPRSPSAPILPPHFASSSYFHSGEPRVKEEPTDVQGILDAWDDMDNIRDYEGYKVSIDGVQPAVKLEDMGLDWDWSEYPNWEAHESSPCSGSSSSPHPSAVKQEESDIVFRDPFAPSLSAIIPPPPIQEDQSFSVARALAEYAETRAKEALAHGATFSSNSRPRAQTAPSLKAFDYLSTANGLSSLDLIAAAAQLPLSLTTLLDTLTFTEPSCVSPHEMNIRSLSVAPLEQSLAHSGVSVRPCHPCEADICATRVDGISVYQSSLGAHTLLRRIDTDFVNLTPIVVHSKSPCPVVSTIPHAVMIDKGRSIVRGMWVPLSAAQAYVRDHPSSSTTSLDIFLRDSLAELFPSTIQELVSSSRRDVRPAGQFGKPFGLVIQARDVAATVPSMDGWEQQHAMPTPAPLPLPAENAPEPPLSPSEQELFQAFCISADWEPDGPTPTITSYAASNALSTPRRSQSLDSLDFGDGSLTPITSSPRSTREDSIEQEESDLALRRSKRVTRAVKTKSTRSRKTKP